MTDGRMKRPKGKKGALVGFGGNNRRRLQGKGPMPGTEDHVYHPVHKRKPAVEVVRREQARLEGASCPRPELSLAPRRELIAGCNAVLEAVRSGISPSCAFVSRGVASDERLSEVIHMATVLGASLSEASHTELDCMADGAVHQGATIEILPYEYADVGDLAERAGKGTCAGGPGLVVALDSVTDPHNLDTVMRSASALGANGVIVSERCLVDVNATAWKVSAEAAARASAVRMSNLVAALNKPKTHGHFTIGFDGRDDTTIEGISPADTPTVFVTGSEGRGFTRPTRETCDAITLVPITAEFESPNVMVTTGIALYQVGRLRVRSQQEEQ